MSFAPGTIAFTECSPTSFIVRWSDDVVSHFPWIWLRDHAHDDDTMHPVTQQRQLFTANLPADLRCQRIDVSVAALSIEWADSEHPPSVVPLSFLAQYRIAQSARIEPATQRTLWDSAQFTAGPPTVDFAWVMNSEDGVAAWLQNVAEFGFCLVLDTPATMAASEALLRRIGYVRETIFGGFWEFTADLTKADTAYTNLELRPHTDGTYSNDAPGAQMLHCLHFDGTGGQSTMVDAFALADVLRGDYPQHYQTLSNVMVPGQYIGDGSHLMAARPVLRHDHSGALVQVSFNNYDRAPFLLPEQEMIEFYDALRVFEALANDHLRQWRHVLAPGEALIFDNWRVLHGRAAFTGRRHMCGGYVNREDLQSRQRQALGQQT